MKTLSFILLLLMVCNQASAAQVTGKDGKTYEGEIIGEDSANFFLQTKDGLITVTKAGGPNKSAVAANKKTASPNSAGQIGSYGLDLTQLAAKVGPGGISKSEAETYTNNFQTPRHKELSGETWGTGLLQLRCAIEDEIVFQEAIKLGLYKENPLKDQVSQIFKAHKTLANVNPANFTLQEIETYFKTHPAEFMTPAQYRFSMTTFSAADRPAAEAQLSEIRKNPSAFLRWKSGGWINEGTNLNIPISEAQYKTIYVLRKGQVSALLPSGADFYVIWCFDYKVGKPKTLDESRDRAVHLMMKEKEAANTGELLKGLKAHSTAEESRLLFEEAVKAGTLRDRSIRDSLITFYLQRQRTTLGKAVTRLKDHYPVEVIPEYQTKR